MILRDSGGIIRDIEHTLSNYSAFPLRIQSFNVYNIKKKTKEK